MKSELCHKCSKKMRIKKIFDETTVTMKCKHCHKTFKLTYDEKTFPTNINSFNWGAFFLWHLWGFWNGIPILSWVGILLGVMADAFYYLSLIDVIISIYLGIEGNKISWEKRNWPSVESFEKAQSNWKFAGLIVFCLAIVVILVCFLYSLNN